MSGFFDVVNGAVATDEEFSFCVGGGVDEGLFPSSFGSKRVDEFVGAQLGGETFTFELEAKETTEGRTL